ncbi:MAG: glutamine amidotransferase [Syntrophomonadaceae bacterium]
MAKFVIAHMYPDLMNLYGDRGNLICLQKRLEWLGQECEIRKCFLGEQVDFGKTDMFFMGGGSDREQELVFQDLRKRAEQLWQALQDGLPGLCICGAYQLLGEFYKAADGNTMPGLAFFQLHTVAEPGRLIGNILIEAEINGTPSSIVGFENHGGRTYFDAPDLKPLGKVLRGFGNNGKDKTEGLLYKNLVGSYLHGPLLPKNPVLADFFIRAMAERKGISIDVRLDDDIESIAHQQVEKMLA